MNETEKKPTIKRFIDMSETLKRLSLLLGPEKANEIFEQFLAENALKTVETVEDLKKVADFLVKKGGFIEVIGRALRTRSIILETRNMAFENGQKNPAGKAEQRIQSRMPPN